MVLFSSDSGNFASLFRCSSLEWGSIINRISVESGVARGLDEAKTPKTRLLAAAGIADAGVCFCHQSGRGSETGRQAK